MKKLTHRKTLRLVTLMLALVLALSACGSSGASGGGAASAPASSGGGSASGNAAAAPAAAAPADRDDIGFLKNETLNFVVPGKAGGGSDLAIRYYAQALTDVYGLRTTVTNYDSNTIGHQTVKSAKPDGATITLATGALNIQYITGNSDIDPMNDFTLIACMQDNGYSALGVPVTAPYDDFAGFVEYAKTHPGEINVGMPAAGANTFLFGQITSALGLELNPVEMSSESDRLTNLAGGFIDIGVVGVGNGLEYEQAGKLKVIGTVASDGTTIDGYPEALPDNFKTLQEQGFQDCYFNVYHYVLGPAGMDPTQAANMNKALEAIYEATKDDIAKIGNIPGWHNMEESQAIRQAEYNQLVEVGKAIGLYAQG